MDIHAWRRNEHRISVDNMRRVARLRACGFKVMVRIDGSIEVSR